MSETTSDDADEGEVTFGADIQKLQRQCVEAWAAFATEIMDLSTRGPGMMQAQPWMNAWTDLWRSCAVRVDELAIVLTKHLQR